MLLVIFAQKWVHHRWKQSQRWVKWNYVFMKHLTSWSQLSLCLTHRQTIWLRQCGPQSSSCSSTWELVRDANSQALTKNLVTQTLWDWGPIIGDATSLLGDSMPATVWAPRVMWIVVLHLLFKSHIYPISISNPSIYLNRESIPELACHSYIHWFIWQNWLSSWHLRYVSRGWEWEMRSFLISKNLQNIR